MNRVTSWWHAFSPSEKHSITSMTAFVFALHLIGWGVLALLVEPQNLHITDGDHRQLFGVGLGLTAYTLGMRHAFDADHIAAIDNTTRKLLGDRGASRPVSVGFWFSLGHSSVVFTMCFLLALGIKAIAGPVQDDSSTLHEVLGVFGPTVSGVFLWVIGILNLVSLVGIVKVWRGARRGHLDEGALEAHLSARGFFARILRGATKSITRPIQMYPTGFLFGLGFDTATEISLLVLASGAAAFALPWYAILTLPILFAAGMSLLDTIDGIFMARAYEWAFAKPLRRLYYNVTVTGLSVVVALIIGTIELAGVVSEKWGITSGPIGWLGSVPLDSVGYVIVALFILTWAVALLVWRFARMDERELHVGG